MVALSASFRMHWLELGFPALLQGLKCVFAAIFEWNSSDIVALSDIWGGVFLVSICFSDGAVFSEVETQSPLDITVGFESNCTSSTYGEFLGSGVFKRICIPLDGVFAFGFPLVLFQVGATLDFLFSSNLAIQFVLFGSASLESFIYHIFEYRVSERVRLLDV